MKNKNHDPQSAKYINLSNFLTMLIVATKILYVFSKFFDEKKIKLYEKR